MAVNLNMLFALQPQTNVSTDSVSKNESSQVDKFKDSLAKAVEKLEETANAPRSSSRQDNMAVNTTTLAVKLQVAVLNGGNQEVDGRTGENTELDQTDLGQQLKVLLGQLEETVELLLTDAETKQVDAEVLAEISALLTEVVQFLQQLVETIQQEPVVLANGEQMVMAGLGTAEQGEQTQEPGVEDVGKVTNAVNSKSAVDLPVPMPVTAETSLPKEAQTEVMDSASAQPGIKAVELLSLDNVEQLESILADAQLLGQKLTGRTQLQVPAAVATLLESITAKLAQLEQSLARLPMANGQTTGLPIVPQSVDAGVDVQTAGTSETLGTEVVDRVVKSPQQKSVQHQETKQLENEQGKDENPVSTAFKMETEEPVSVSKRPLQSTEGVTTDFILANDVKPLLHRIQQLQQVLVRNTEARPVLSQVVERVQVMVADKQSSMELQLRPEHLGKLSLKISIEQGVVKAQFVAESQQVRQLIEANLTNLKHSLANLGMQIDEVNVSVAQGEGQGQGERHAPEQHLSKRQANEAMVDDEVAFSVPEYGSELDDNTTIDYKV